MPDLTDRTTLITGCSGALGSVLTAAMLRAGTGVVGAYRSEPELGTLMAELASHDLDGRFLPVRADVTDEASVAALFAAARERWGRVDILLNLVGGVMPPTPVAELSLADWNRQLALNLTSAFLCAREAAPQMIETGWGRIVSISSKRAVEPAAKYAPYACSKAAVIALTQTLSEELKGHGVTVNAILPAVINTRAMREALPKADHGRWTPPEQIAALIAHLCSEDAAAITGAAIPIYGRM